MKKSLLPFLVVLLTFFSEPVLAQADTDTASLGLAGDNLDLYAVLELFQKSKTIEAFEKSLNLQETKINNLDLDLDKKVDFIKVVTKQKDSSFQFILQVAISKTENQDVAVILVDKDKKGNVSLQIVGDEELYGKDYVIEPKPAGSTASSITANPAYQGPDPVVVNVPATTTVVVQSAPVVQYVYSPAYVPYYPPYVYGYYPPYFAAFTVMAVGIYRHNNYHYHGHYHGGHYGGGNTVVINNRNNYNNYNNNRAKSNTVSNNKARGNYGNGAGASNRASASTRPSNGGANRASTGSPSQRLSPTTSDRSSPGGSASRNSASNRSASSSSYSRPSTSNRSSSSYSSANRSRSGGGGGGGRSGGGGRRR